MSKNSHESCSKCVRQARGTSPEGRAGLSQPHWLPRRHPIHLLNQEERQPRHRQPLHPSTRYYYLQNFTDLNTQSVQDVGIEKILQGGVSAVHVITGEEDRRADVSESTGLGLESKPVCSLVPGAGVHCLGSTLQKPTATRHTVRCRDNDWHRVHCVPDLIRQNLHCKNGQSGHVKGGESAHVTMSFNYRRETGPCSVEHSRSLPGGRN